MRYVITFMLLGFFAGCCCGQQPVKPHADEYYDFYPKMPFVHVELTFPYSTTAEWYRHTDLIKADMKVFADIVRQFAVTNGLHDCQNPHYGIYSGGILCSFKSDLLEIKTSPTDSASGCDRFEIAPIEAAHMTADVFKSQTEPLLKSLQARFPDRLKVEFKTCK